MAQCTVCQHRPTCTARWGTQPRGRPGSGYDGVMRIVNATARKVVRRIGHDAAERPRWPMALRGALAATLAWLVVQPFGGLADDYPYYAPLGAVVAVSMTVAGSLRDSLRAELAIAIGALLAITTGLMPIPGAVDLAIVVGLGTLLAGWRAVGAMGSWIPVSGTFVLIIGHSDLTYAVAYLGLTGLGAAVGIVVNLALPNLSLTPSRSSATALLEALAGQLDDLAEGLSQHIPPTRDEWGDRQWRIRPRAQQLDQLTSEVLDAQHGNWRARRRQTAADHQYHQTRALVRLSFVVEDVTQLVVDRENVELDRTALGPTLRAPTAEVLRATAALLRSADGLTADMEPFRAAEDAVAVLVAAIDDAPRESVDDVFAAGAIVTAVRRAVSSLAPVEPPAP